MLAVKSGFILFIKNYQFPIQINTLEREELGLLRAHWIIGPPFVDRKSLATMSNAGDVGG